MNSTPPSQQHPKSQSQPEVTSYANVASTTCFPKKDQAVILDSIDGITLREYLISLSSIIPANSIRFISRISNARVCVYLDSKKTADSLTEERKQITIKENVLEIKPLITRNKRIVLSNVCPVIPHLVIEQKFQELNIKIMSPITFMKVGVTDPGFSHILSFRRQLFISPEDEKHLPESFQINYEGTNYWIYVSTDSLKCFSCNTTGHLAKNCPQKLTTSQPNDINDPTAAEEINTIFERNDNLPKDFVFPTPIIEEYPKLTQSNQKGKKRIRSPTISEASNTQLSKPQVTKENESDIIENETDETSSNLSLDDIDVIKVNAKKKLKKNDRRTEEEVWKDVERSMIELNPPFPVSLDQFISLLDNARGKQNVKELVYSYTDNINGLINMCNKLHGKMNKGLKNRCSRLTRKLQEIVNPVPFMTSDTDPDTSLN